MAKDKLQTEMEDGWMNGWAAKEGGGDGCVGE